MKRKGSFTILLITCTTGILLWALWPRSKDSPPGSPVARTAETNSNSEDGKPYSAAPSGVLPEILHNTREARERRLETADDRSLNEWRTAINFYGKAVDENGHPVSGVSVKIGVTDLSANGHSTYYATSDQDGLFLLEGVTGKHLSISEIEKPGYYVSNRNPRSFFYAGRNNNFLPSSSAPVLFHLRKHGKAEPLQVSSGRVKVPLDMAPLEVDVRSGRAVTSGGHVRFFADSEPDASKQEYNWKLKVTVPDGGIQDTGEEFPFLAPDDGYQPELEISMNSNSPSNWENMIRRSFYVQLPDGQYGRLSIFFVAYNGVLRFDAAVNPSGSRNLEPAQE